MVLKFMVACLIVFGGLAARAQGGTEATEGKWSDPIALGNVAIHIHVLPNGKVLFWGRRQWTNGAPDSPAQLDEQECTPRIWDPEDPGKKPKELIDPALRGSAYAVNLFCSGHVFLPSGKLLTVGGHIKDNSGSNKVRSYDFTTNLWAVELPMDSPGKGGRWYPSALTLSDGSVLVAGGTDLAGAPNTNIQLFKDGAWSTPATFANMPYYPMLHLAPDGRVFLSGPIKDRKTQLFNVATKKFDVVGDTFLGKDRDYGSSVMYDVGKVILIGGGIAPQASAEMIDLNEAAPAWKPAGEMAKGRRHHNSTLLPDGSIFVNGGTSGDGGPNGGFNDTTQPVTTAELWNPVPPRFTPMAKEDFPRLYHSASVLLPDGRVLSAGGGEYRPDNKNPNAITESIQQAQIYSPPYLFHGPRPAITSAPLEVTYGSSFEVSTPDQAAIEKVSWVRLSSVTHAFNQNQRINFLKFVAAPGKLTVSAPPSGLVCPPGHYILFILNKEGVPSKGSIIRIN